MAGDEKMQTRTVKHSTMTQISIQVDEESKSNINSIHDKVMLQMLEDCINENETLKLIEKRMWDPRTETAKFDVKDSTVLKLMYGKPLDK